MPEVVEATQAEPAPKSVHEHRHEHKNEDLDMGGISENLDKININMPGAEGGMNGMLAAMMANKDQGGMGTMWPLLLLFLLRRGGLEGDVAQVANATGVDRCEITAILSKLGDLQAAGPLSTAQIATFLATQTGEITNQISQQSLFISQGFASLGDKVTNTAAAGIAAGQANTAQLATLIQKGIDLQNSIDRENLSRQLTVAELNHRDERTARQIESNSHNQTININNLAAAQAQATAVSVARIEEDRWSRLESLISFHNNQIAANVSRVTQFGTGNVATPTNTTTNQNG